MSAPAVAAAHLSAGYGQRAALRGVEFAVPPGAIVGVLGPNGGGKTTLMRTLLGELEPLAGECSVNGEIAYVPQNEDTRRDLPLRARDVALMGAYARTPFYRRIARADHLRTTESLQRLGLADVADARYGDLSRGQRQRVLVARALVRDAPVMLLDEPFAGIDAANAARLERTLLELRDEGRTLLVATHDVDQARAWDLALCLNAEQIAFGPVAQTLSPETLAATFGAEIIALPDGDHAIAVRHHDHHGH